jgi:hypothetical protein
MPVKTRRNSPYAPIPIRSLFQLVKIIFFHPVGRIGDDSMETVLGHLAKPLEAIGMDDL